jgi:Tfp pilus assembly protein PilZ
MSGRDQRRDERIETSQRVWVEGQDLRVTAEAKNMSKGGMFVVTDKAPESIGSHVEITFDDPLEGRVTLAMEVVWKREDVSHAQLGLRTVNSADSRAFQRVVERYIENSDAHAGADAPASTESAARSSVAEPSSNEG